MQYSSPSKGQFAAIIFCLSRKASSWEQIALDDEPNNDKRIKNCEEGEGGEQKYISRRSPDNQCSAGRGVRDAIRPEAQ